MCYLNDSFYLVLCEGSLPTTLCRIVFQHCFSSFLLNLRIALGGALFSSQNMGQKKNVNDELLGMVSVPVMNHVMNWVMNSSINI